ncbi:MAG: MFS transporter [Pseudomonadota bacterium]|jgi:fucose permease|uniref:Predicted trehalose permease, MFS family, FucP subfamily n=1 Tax=hydrothermal vent metagenome TaxID=652676 RepID=A0A170PPA6_9ZZZZ
MGVRARATIALILTYAVLGLLMNSVGVVILQSIRHYAITKTHASSLEACKDLSVVAASFLLATRLPAFGFRRALIAVMLVVGAGALLMSVANAFWATQLFFVLTGVCFGSGKVATYASIGLLRPDRAGHASLTGLVEGVFMIGVLIGVWMFSWFIGADSTGTDWLHVYWVIAAICAVTAGLWAITPLDESRAAPESVAAQAPGWRQMLRLLALPTAIAFLVSIFLYVLIEQSIGTWLPTFNNEILHLPPEMSVQASSIFVASLAVGRLGASALLRRIAWLPLMLGCILCIAALVLVTLPTTQGLTLRPDVGWFDAPVAAYVFPLIGVFMAPIYPTLCSVMLTSLPQERHAAMVGLMVIFSALGGTIGSFLTGMIFQHLSGQNAFYMTLVPLALIAVALVRFNRMIDREEGVATVQPA